MNLSARACHRILKLERRIADWAGSGGEPIRAFGGGVAVATQVDKLGGNLRMQMAGSILYIDKKKVSWENVTSYGNSYRTVSERIGIY